MCARDVTSQKRSAYKRAAQLGIAKLRLERLSKLAYRVLWDRNEHVAYGFGRYIYPVELPNQCDVMCNGLQYNFETIQQLVPRNVGPIVVIANKTAACYSS
jgi:hypothetical protein